METQKSSRLDDRALLEILSLSQNATAIYTGDDIIIEMANDKMISFWGKDRSVIGKSLLEAVPELRGQEFFGILQQVWRSGTTYEGRSAAASLNTRGVLETFYFDFTYQAVKRADGSMLCILHTATDVTEQVFGRKQLQEKEEEVSTLNRHLNDANNELKAVAAEAQASNSELLRTQENMLQLNARVSLSESIFRSFFEQAALGIAWFNGPNQVIEAVNEPLLKIWDRNLDEVLGKPHREARPELEDQPVFDLLDAVYQTGVPKVNNEMRLFLKSGDTLREVYVNSVYSPIIDTNGTVTGVLATVDDVTDRVKERRQKEFLQEQLRVTIESAELGTWYFDGKTNELVASPRVKELFGFYADEPMTLDQAVAQIQEDYRDLVTAAMDATVQRNKIYDVEYPIVGYHDGNTRWVKAFGKLYYAGDGSSPQFSGVLIDITNRKNEENRKNDFIAIVSHELKTPLTTAKGFTQLLRAKAHKANDAFLSGSLLKIEQQIEKMTMLIKSFLDVARLEAGKIQLNMQPFEISELLAECVAEAKSLSQHHQLTITHADVVTVNADKDKIAQVVSNLLSNAIKYSPKGKLVEITCTQAAGYLEVRVRDEGMGVKPQDQAHLFDRFYRVENKHTLTISGFGIGLYLCAEIIHMHKGQIGLESKIGEGSTFYFTLPLDA
ncbi:ATP-binding protein [Mucilaginibacter sp. CSA2-8R]|uniref:PAS domain-containing sensor histidine kinase n=1 Tax=Mucilaginibacter sp. CSA2-8R TaxID=3141542 RepID=UPI00315D9535